MARQTDRAAGLGRSAVTLRRNKVIGAVEWDGADQIRQKNCGAFEHSAQQQLLACEVAANGCAQLRNAGLNLAGSECERELWVAYT